MANEETLANLQARALDYADMTGSSFPVTARVTNYINAAASDLYDLLIDAGWFSKTQTITLIAGTESYSLSADFFRVQEVSYISGDRKYPLHRYERKELHGVQRGPQTSGTVELDYAPHFIRMDLSSITTIDLAFANGAQLPNGWEDYIAMQAASKLLGREESERWMAGDIAEMRQRYAALADPQDRSSRVADVYGRYASYPFPPTAYRIVYRVIGKNIHFLELSRWGA